MLLSGLNVEGGVPGVEVADFDRAVGAGGVTVGEHLLAECFVAILFCPGLGEGEEELLVARESVMRGRGLARQ